MEFAFIISHDAAFRPTEALLDAISTWIDVQSQAGRRIDGRPLAPPDAARTVRVRNGSGDVTHGPTTTASDQVCAFELYRCDSMEHAVRLAAEHPMASAATVEVRPVWQPSAAA